VSMNRIVLLMLVIFVLEGSLLPWLIPNSYSDRIFSHFIFVIVIFSALYGSRYQALVLGMSFGLLQDVIYYGHVIGPHFFFMGLIGYLVGVVLERKKTTLLLAISVVGFACLAYDSALYFVYSIFRITNGTYAWALIQYILPSLFLQLAFTLCTYVPLRKMFEKRMRNAESSEEI
jgi:rod shape-determining protein MreD